MKANSHYKTSSGKTFKVFLTIESCMLLAALPLQICAAPGDVDLSFDPGSSMNGPVFAVGVQPDGKILIGGSFSTVHGAMSGGLARLNADGTTDTTFSSPWGPTEMDALALQPDGKFLVVGGGAIARLNADGSLGNSFKIGFASSLSCIALQSDGKILVGGFGSFSGQGSSGVVRLNADGAVTSAPAMLQVIPGVERRSVPGIEVAGAIGILLSLDYASTLSPAPNWIPLDSVSLASTSQFYFDQTQPLPPQRFYRTRLMGKPVVAPLLDLQMIPAITLTGSIGDSLRLDYINQFGPTDAWTTLATITLTNTSQPYFDTSAIGQPPRLWRIVPVP
jgi:uncharacterized delta-60 repeat protein